jgi:hypothetical protein
MPIRHSPVLTHASLAARRANALKSTGARTVRGKARVSLKAQRYGRSAVPFARLPERLLRTVYRQQESLYSRLHSRIAQAFGAQNLQSQDAADRMATTVWCLATGRSSHKTKLECPLYSITWTLQLPSDQQMVRLRFKVKDEWRRIGLVFWVQRKKYRTVARLLRVLLGVQSVACPGPKPGLETRVRSRIFRLRRPALWSGRALPWTSTETRLEPRALAQSGAG